MDQEVFLALLLLQAAKLHEDARIRSREKDILRFLDSYRGPGRQLYGLTFKKEHDREYCIELRIYRANLNHRGLMMGSQITPEGITHLRSLIARAALDPKIFVCINKTRERLGMSDKDFQDIIISPIYH